MGWLAAVDYRQGALHRAHHQPCQDFGLVVKPNAGCVVGALADGDGGARLSHIGAQSAVKAAAASLSDSAIDHPDTTGGDLETALQAVRDALLHEAAGRACAVEELATSLLAFVLTEGRIAAIRVGDGFLISGAPSQPYRTVGQPCATASAPASVTDPDADAEITIIDGPVTFVAAGTEGLQELTIPAGRRPPPFVFPPPLEQLSHRGGKRRRNSPWHPGIPAVGPAGGACGGRCDSSAMRLAGGPAAGVSRFMTRRWKESAVQNERETRAQRKKRSSVPQQQTHGILRDAPFLYYRIDRPADGGTTWTLRLWSTGRLVIPALDLVSGISGRVLLEVQEQRLEGPAILSFEAPSLPGTVTLQSRAPDGVAVNLVHPPTQTRWVGPKAAPPGPKASLSSFV